MNKRPIVLLFLPWLTVWLFALAFPATAQTGQRIDPCGAPLRSGYVADAAPTVSPYAGPGYPGSGYYGGSGGYGSYGNPYAEGTPLPTPTPTPIPQPQNPVEKVCEFGAVRIVVSADRYFTYRIGDRIRISVTIETAPNVMLDFTSLESRQLLLDVLVGDFEMAEVPVITSARLANGSVRHTIELTVQTWKMSSIVWFVMELRYATGFETDGITPDYKRLTTPPFQITTTRTHDHGNEPILGDPSMQQGSLPALAMPLITLGLVLVFFAPSLVVYAWLRRRRPGRILSANELARHELALVFAGASGNFGRKECERIASIVTKYLDGGEVRSSTLKEVLDYLSTRQHPQAQAVERVLKTCVRVAFAPGDQEPKLLLHEVEQLKHDLSAIFPPPEG